MYSKQQLSDHRVVLQYHLDLLDSKKSYFLYCQCLRLKILPLIRLIAGAQIKKWIEEKQKYFEVDKLLKSNVIFEIKSISAILQKRLLDVGLLENINIQEKIASLNSILEFRPEVFVVGHEYDSITKEIRKLDTSKQHQSVWVMPSQNTIAVARLKELCYEIMSLNREDLITDYVEEFSSGLEPQKNTNDDTTVYQCHYCFKCVTAKYLKEDRHLDLDKDLLICPLCGNEDEPLVKQFIYVENRYILLFNDVKFIPSYFTQLKKEAAFWDSPVGAWEMLCSIEWYWDADNRDYFRKKLHYNDVEQCENSVRLLNLNLMRSEVKIIKHKKVMCLHASLSVFNSEKDFCENIDACVKKATRLNRDAIVSGKIQEHIYNTDSVDVLSYNRIDHCKDLVINKLCERYEINSLQQFNGPEEIEIYINDKDCSLLLKVRWSSNIIERYLLNHFHDEDGFRLKFFEDLIASPGIVAPLSNAQKYLREAGLTGIFKKIFIGHVDKNGATLTSNHIMLRGRSAAQLKKIRMQIQTFKTLSWD